ncbi:hypothetical protein ADM99_04205 [Leptolinea tardivitalis]|uniref:Nitroreductase domain-containing protein n=2 Tax=Leptolinea tardivitalis TaxID=229920 RepID=A0A0P6XEF6_9CHLR|nr:hypothetical protein ADM99_04205 [Leptolinea tardivitalis]
MSMLEQKKELIQMASLAASGHNAQPWKFEITERGITILPDLSRRLPVVDPDDRELWISLGCALENLVVAARAAGLNTEVTYPDISEKINIDLKDAETEQDELFNALALRQNTRSMYDGNTVQSAELDKLMALPVIDGIFVDFFNESDEITTLSEFIRQSTIKQYSDPLFINELIHWLRFNKKEALSMDGLYTRCSGNPEVPRFIGQLFISGIKPEKQAEEDIQKLVSSAGAVMISTETDSRSEWVKTGRIYERLVLQMTALNIQSALLNQPIEVPEIRGEMTESLHLKGARPQMLVRFGHAQLMPGSLRRPVGQILI